MAFPFLFESNFEGGTNAEWDSETDTEGVLNIRHYSSLAKEDASKVGPIAPWRGAYCAEWFLTGDTSDHTLIEGDLDIADDVTRYTRFMLFLGKDLTGVTDIFNIFELQGTADAVEAAIGLRITTGASVVEIGIGQTAPATFATQPLHKGRWYTIELKTLCDTAGAGTSDLYVDGALVQSITTITNTAILRGVLGTQNTLSTTTGHLYIDAFAFDDARLYPARDRFPVTQILTKTGHVFVGPGWIELVAIQSAAGSVICYDTDTANTDAADQVVDLDLARGFATYEGGAYFARGCYAVLSGSNPRIEVKLLTSNADRRKFGPHAYGSTGAIRQYGYKRKARPQNV
jgi:hypothetical protein